MARLTIKLTENELHEIQRLAKLRELAPPQLGYQAFVRFMEIESRNPRAPIEIAPFSASPAVPARQVADNMQVRCGVMDPLDAVRNSADPHFTARIQALAALSCHDETSIFLPLASSLLTAIFLYTAENAGGRPNTIRSVHDLLKMSTEDFLGALQRIRKGLPGQPAHAAFQHYFERPYSERDQAQRFALQALELFFEPVLAEPMQNSRLPSKVFERSLTIMVAREEHLAFVNLASRLNMSPAWLGREAIQRLIGHNRPHLALVAGEHGKD